MATSRWATVVDALVDVMRARVDCRAPGQDADETLTLVLDGKPEWDMTGDPAPTAVVIGADILNEDDPGRAGQSVATLGNRARDENGIITCTAVAQSGGVVLATDGTSTVRALRTQAFAVMAAVETEVRAAPALGISAPFLQAQVGGTEMAVSQYLTDTGGAVCALVFSVQFDTRI